MMNQNSFICINTSTFIMHDEDAFNPEVNHVKAHHL